MKTININKFFFIKIKLKNINTNKILNLQKLKKIKLNRNFRKIKMTEAHKKLLKQTKIKIKIENIKIKANYIY